MTQDQVDQVDEDAGKPSAEELTDSLTGWEELAIIEATERPLAAWGALDPIMTLRLLVAVAEARRLKVRYREAYRAAMEMDQRAALDYFDDAVDVMPGEPDTAAGKGD